MEQRCIEARSAWNDGRDGAPAAQGAVEHARVCAPCRAWMARAQRATAALCGLERRASPAELDGLVVAALYAGYREVRAVRSLEDLSALAAPEIPLADQAAVTGLLAELPPAARGAAPAELERLVAADLAEGTAARVRRPLRELARRAAPPELAARLERDLRAGRARRGDRGLRRAAIAAALCAALGIAWWSRSEPAPELEGLHTAGLAFDFEIVRAGGPEQLSPAARAFLAPVVGGLVPRAGSQESALEQATKRAEESR